MSELNWFEALEERDLMLDEVATYAKSFSWGRIPVENLLQHRFNVPERLCENVGDFMHCEAGVYLSRVC